MPSGTPARARQDRNHVSFAHPPSLVHAVSSGTASASAPQRRSFLLQVSPPLLSGGAHGSVRGYHPCRGVQRCREYHGAGYELAHCSLSGVLGYVATWCSPCCFWGFFILATLPVDPQTTIGSGTSRDQNTYGALPVLWWLGTFISIVRDFIDFVSARCLKSVCLLLPLEIFLGRSCEQTVLCTPRRSRRELHATWLSLPVKNQTFRVYRLSRTLPKE